MVILGQPGASGAGSGGYFLHELQLSITRHKTEALRDYV